MAYGQRNTITTDLSKFILGMLGESGIGKTTTMFHMAETLFGLDGYWLWDIGSEFGTECIEGIASDQVETFKDFLNMVNDVVKNKNTKYKNLKLIIIDTLDALFEIGEPYLTKLYNSEHMGEKGFIPAKTINAAEGGFMHGQDRLIDIVVEQIVKLRKVGVGFWYTGHVKRRSTDDVFSGDSYDQLTTSMSQRYFSAIKNKTHALGIAYINRDLTEQEIGKENPVTKKKKTTIKIVSEDRKVKFRDDSYTADSKSRLQYIVDEVNLDEHEIIQALKDAIEEEKKNPYKANVKNTTTKKKASSKQKAEEVTEEAVVKDVVDEDELADEVPVDDIFDIDDDEVDEVIDEVVDEERLKAIRAAFKNSDADVKAEVKEILKSNGGKLSADMNILDIKEIEKILGV